MKSLLEYISEATFNRNIEFYDLNVVSESLKDPKLMKLTNYLKKFASKSNNYKFTRPFTKDGEEAKWHQVVEFIKANGPVSKREIVKAIWGYDELDRNIRGYQSFMFAQLNEIQPEGVHYDKDLKKWTV